MRDPVRLRDLASRYDAILCDVWGVVRDGSSILNPAVDALIRFRKTGKPVLLLSNSPRRSGSLINHLDEMADTGLSGQAWDGAVTSGDGTFEILKSMAPGPAYKLGPDFDDPLYEGTGLQFADLKDARFISCTGPIDCENETVDDYRDLLKEARLRHLPMVCANPDKVVQHGDRLLPCGGALAELYEELGGETIYAGKPHPPIYDLAYRRLAEISGRAFDADQILVIGDGPETDLLGAQQEGLDSLFISGGILGDINPENTDAALAQYGVSARWYAKSLQW